MRKLLVAATLLITLLPPTFAFAEDSNSPDIESNRRQIKTNLEERSKERKLLAASKAAEIKDKLDAVKLKVCETRQNIIKRRSQSLANRANTQFNVFDSIATKVENFYTTKVLPKGVVVANYDQLVADIATQKTDAMNAIDTAKTDATNFDCSGDNPKAQLTNFNSDMKLAIAALKDYRTAIRNLIVAVKSAIGKFNSASSSAKTASSSALSD